MRRERDGSPATVPNVVGLLHLLCQAAVVVVVVPVVPGVLHQVVAEAVAGVASPHLVQNSPQAAWLRCNWLPIV